MNRVRMLLVLVVALGAGMALAVGTYRFTQNVPVQTASSAQVRPVVVAVGDLPLGSELRGDDLKVIEWPAASVPEGAFSQPAELVGRGLIASVVRNELILPAKLAAQEAGVGLPPIIPSGMRAVSVRTNEVIGVAGYVLPGTRVDVIATASPGTGRGDVTSKVVLANVQVLTSGTRMEPDQERGRPMPVTVVTLLVDPEQSERLALASTEGKIQLALRNPLDQETPQTPGIRPAVLMGSVRAVRPAAPASGAARAVEIPAPAPEPRTVTVEMIRGDKREREVVR